jgi:uncharacterized protein (DUF58 family)
MTAGDGERGFTPLYRALTPRGIMVFGGGLAVAVVGLVLHYAELIAVGAVGVVAAGAALALVARAPRVTVTRTIEPAKVTRNSPHGAVAHVVVRGASRRTVPAMAARDLAGPGVFPFPVPRLRRGQVSEVPVPLPVGRRGLVPSGPLLVDRDDAFGLAHRILNTGTASVLYVRPRAVPLPEVSASLARSVDGPQSDNTTEGTLAFNSLREYVPGDELRHVHWRASAHANKLVVKQHVDMAYAAVAVVLDAFCASGADTFDVAVDCAASVAVIAAQQRQPLQLLDGAGQSLLPKTTARRGITADVVLDSLTPLQPASPGPVDPLADTVRRLAAGARGSLAVVVSTRPTRGLAEPLRLLAGRYARVVAVQVAEQVTAGSRSGPPAPPAQVTRTGRVVWVIVRAVDDLSAALLRARSAA